MSILPTIRLSRGQARYYPAPVDNTNLRETPRTDSEAPDDLRIVGLESGLDRCRNPLIGVLRIHGSMSLGSGTRSQYDRELVDNPR
jgi:hypothetical protein